MNRIFVTGSRGFIGDRVMERLDGDCVFPFLRGMDITSKLQEFKPTHIIHLAGEIYDQDRMFDSNVVLTNSILNYCKGNSDIVSMVYVGSSSEYGQKSEPMKENDVLEPRTIYEATKGCGTLLCQGYAKEYKVPVSIARPFSVYGKGEARHRFIPTLLAALKFGYEVKIHQGSHDFIHIDDFISGIFLLLFEKQTKGKIYNFGTGDQYTNLQVAELLERISGKKLNKVVLRDKIRSFDSSNWVADIENALSIRWRPEYTLEQGLRSLI